VTIYQLLAGFLTAFVITFFSIPSIIKIAHIKNLCDEPDERRAHTERVPTLGGLGIFAGLIFSITFWIPFDAVYAQKIQYILSAYIIIFLIGAKDDIVPLTPIKKFGGELVATIILVYKADISLTSLYGIFGFYDIDVWLAIPLSIFTILLIINAFNLIDGINGLAATIGIICAVCFGFWFFEHGRSDLAILATAIAGALVAFLYYNITPARIFMGDTGSLLLGLSISILAISFIESNKATHGHWHIQSVPAVAVGIMIIPLFDTLRVFMLRALRGRSPFSPDKTHIHHLLLAAGYSHTQSTIILGLVNILFIALAYLLQGIGTLYLLIVLLLLAILLTAVAFVLARRKGYTTMFN
jgi:UDP-GlcNAc:undecaprenyl-phosphate/decaprenyl-phosphate GlcNAc-1-phosphate transferase